MIIMQKKIGMRICKKIAKKNAKKFVSNALCRGKMQLAKAASAVPCLTLLGHVIQPQGLVIFLSNFVSNQILGVMRL